MERLKVRRRRPSKALTVRINADTWLLLKDLARDRKITASDLVRACVDQCLPCLKSGDFEIQDGSGDQS